jgi:hypothetical protein
MFLSRLSKFDPYLSERTTANLLCVSFVMAAPVVAVNHFIELSDNFSLYNSATLGFVAASTLVTYRDLNNRVREAFETSADLAERFGRASCAFVASGISTIAAYNFADEALHAMSGGDHSSFEGVMTTETVLAGIVYALMRAILWMPPTVPPPPSAPIAKKRLKKLLGRNNDPK